MTIRMRRWWKTALVFGAILFAVGCAQLSPQRVDFQSSISDEQLIQTQGKASLTVSDNRDDPVIGYRGGVYAQSATIEFNQSVTKVVEEVAINTLGQMGLEVDTIFPDVDINIAIDRLTYKTENKTAGVKRYTVSAALSIAVQRGNETYQRQYAQTEYQETFGYPSEERNSEILNRVLNSVLERMFSDPETEAFLNR